MCISLKCPCHYGGDLLITFTCSVEMDEDEDEVGVIGGHVRLVEAALMVSDLVARDRVDDVLRCMNNLDTNEY